MQKIFDATDNIPSWVEQEIPPGLKRKYFSSSYGKIHFLSGGKGEKCLFLHGNPMWSLLWRKVIAKLDLSKIEVIAPDLLNLGLSDSLNKSDFNLKNHANSIAELIDALNLENITLILHDWGGPIGILAASLVRTPVKRLIILNTGLKAPAAPFKISKFHSFVNKKILPDLAFKIFRFPMYSLHKTQTNRETLKGNKAEIYRYPIKRYSRWDSALLFARMVPTYAEHPSLSHFEAIETYCKNFENNAEIIWGIKDPIMGRSLNSIQKLLPKARTIKLDAGHFLQEEKPDEIARCIMQIQ